VNGGNILMVLSLFMLNTNVWTFKTMLWDLELPVETIRGFKAWDYGCPEMYLYIDVTSYNAKENAILHSSLSGQGGYKSTFSDGIKTELR
jgi:hypothetical protein